MTREKDVLWHVVLILGVVAALFHLYTGGIALMSAMVQRAVHVMLMLLLTFLCYGMAKRSSKALAVLDIVWCGLSVASTIYLLRVWEYRTGVQIATAADVIFGIVMIFLVLEAARRTTGLTLVIVALVFLAYALFGSQLPGFLGHRGYSLSRITSYLYLTTEGIYGIPIGISSTFIVLFVLFGALLDATGGGKVFIDAAFAVTGRTRGGPAKAAVVSSALMGTISGSPIANVVTTGTFTIPLMKKLGYAPHVAAAVEAVASTGGMIMPPVMGAAAFIMAEYLNTTYREIMISAVIPAVLYYVCIYFIVDFEALKRKLFGLPRSELPSLGSTLRTGGHLITPLIILVILVVMRYSPMKAAFWSILSLLAVSQLKSSSRLTLLKFFEALRSGVQNALPVAIACAAAGIVLGVIAITGLGVKFSSLLMSLSGGSLFVGLLITMATSLVLGMGLPATAVYLLTAALNAPALVELGASPLAAHMFVFYFGVISAITPPVALAAYAAAGIANASPNRTGWTAFAFGVVAYVVPYMFVYSPALLMKGNPWFILFSFASAAFGVYWIASGIEGILVQRLSVLERGLFLAGGMLLVQPGAVTDGVGLLSIAAGLLLYGARTRFTGGFPFPVLKRSPRRRPGTVP